MYCQNLKNRPIFGGGTSAQHQRNMCCEDGGTNGRYLLHDTTLPHGIMCRWTLFSSDLGVLRESVFTNISDGRREDDICQVFAIIERTLSNACHAIRDGDRGQVFATIERTISNACHTIRNGHGSQRVATPECPISNTRYATWDDRCLTTSNKGIRCSLNNRITIITTIVYWIVILDCDRSQNRATMEQTLSNARHAIRDSDRSQTRATTERTFSNARHAIRDGDGGQVFATTERTTNYILDARLDSICSLI